MPLKWVVKRQDLNRVMEVLQMQQKVICVKCGAENAPNTPFCLYCGAMLQTTCANCGSSANPNARFCSTCGAGLGWSVKIKDIQSQISQTEGNIVSSFGQYAGDMRNSLAGMQGDLKNTLSAYSNEMIANQQSLNDTATNISELIKEEHRLARSKALNRSGLGVIALGLGIIASSYFFTDIPLLPVIGLAVVFAGFVVQLVSNFSS
jgi:predicted amidophosphoribosyltransferase